MRKIQKLVFFFKKSYFLNLNLNFICFQLFFELHNISFAQNFQIFIFLAIKFPLMTNSIPWPLAAKIVIRGDCFGYLWTDKDQNIYLRSSFTISAKFYKLNISACTLCPPSVQAYITWLKWPPDWKKSSQINILVFICP